MNTPGNDRMHELLCAYLLEEVDANEKAQVEEALAASSELRAERDRLEQTLGLVHSAYQGEEALSESAFASVLEQAEKTVQPARPRFVLLRPAMLRAAAALVVVVTGTWSYLQRGEVGSSDEQVAVAFKQDAAAGAGEKRLEQERSRRKNGAADTLKAIGYGTSDDAVEQQPGARQLSKAEMEAMRSIGYVNSDGPGKEALEALGYADEEQKGQLRELGYVGQEARDDRVAGEPMMLGEIFEAETDQGAFASAPMNRPAEVSSEAGIVLADGDSSARLKSLGYVSEEAPKPEVSPAPSSQVAVGDAKIGEGKNSSGQFGGRFGKKREAEPQRQLSKAELSQLQALGYGGGGGGASATPATPSPTATGTYRGPGDTVAPGKAGAAPSKDGEDLDDMREALAALDRGSVITGADNFFLGQGEAERARNRPSPAEREEFIREWREHIIRDCYPRPKDLPRDMYFRFWGDNSFELTKLDNLSTFSADVDTASYALARRYLAEGNIPTKAQIRTEEFLNSFDPDVPAPSEGTFAIQTEMAPSRFSGDRERSMLRVGIRGREVAKSERKPISVTFVIDTSGSMRENGRLELVKHAVRLLVGELNENDSIAIVAYSNSAHIALPLTSADRGGDIEAAIYPLQPGGSTNAEAGLMLGYQVAQAGLEPNRNHRVVFLSDGVANVGQTDQDRLAKSVRQNVDAGIYLNTIGVGMNNHNDVFLEQLADKGDGVCDYIDSPKAAKRAIVERFTGAFETIASDVKIQVEFDAKQVHRYRLLGYENRSVADVDFRNDAVDAGEVGAGHQVVALYELELTPDAAAEAPLATVRLRYKEPAAVGQDPRESDVTELEAKVLLGDSKESYAATSSGYRKSVVVAQFAEFLRRSTHARMDSFEELLSETALLAREVGTPEFDEFLGMVKKAYQLGPPADLRGDLELTLDEFRRFQILRRELESLNNELDGELLKELKERNTKLEEELRDLITREIDKKG